MQKLPDEIYEALEWKAKQQMPKASKLETAVRVKKMQFVNLAEVRAEHAAAMRTTK